MKIIHIAGWSGSGKTTFIRNLVQALAPLGKVGTVKHIGDHICEMPAGKDTTVHFEAGASVTAGIDPEKTIVTSRSVTLSDSLDLLSDSGVRYAVVEGFKRFPFIKVVIGDLDVPALIRNPSVTDVISLLDSFDDYYTLSGLIRESGCDLPGEFLYCMSGICQFGSPVLRDCLTIEEEINRWEGVSMVRVRSNRPLPGSPGRFFVVCKVTLPVCGSHVLTRCNDLFSGCIPEGTDSDGGI